MTDFLVQNFELIHNALTALNLVCLLALIVSYQVEEMNSSERAGRVRSGSMICVFAGVMAMVALRLFAEAQV